MKQVPIKKIVDVKLVNVETWDILLVQSDAGYTAMIGMGQPAQLCGTGATPTAALHALADVMENFGCVNPNMGKKNV